MRRPSTGTVIAFVALFVSLTGTATAAKLLVTSKQIKDGTIQLVDMSTKARARLGTPAGAPAASASVDPSPDVRLNASAFTTVASAAITMRSAGRLMTSASLRLVSGALLPTFARCRLFIEDGAVLSQEATVKPHERGESMQVALVGARLLPAGTYKVLARCGVDRNGSDISFASGDLLVWVSPAAKAAP